MDYSSKLVAAFKDVTENKLSLRQAATKWDVKRTTLCDRVTGKVKVEATKGPSKFLTTTEETALADWLIGMAERGFGVTKKQLLYTVKEILDKNKRSTPLKNKSPSNLPGNKWYKQFLRRNRRVKLIKPRKLDIKRAKVSKDQVDKWFQDYEVFLSDHDLLDKPSNIWNCDESGFALQVKTGKVLGPAKHKICVPQIVSSNKGQITALVAVNAAGSSIPPYYLFPQKQAPRSWNPLAGSTDGSACYFNESGWMDTEAFFCWFANHFIPNLPPARPVALIFDGHQSHIDYELFKVARDNNILLYKLLPNSSHFLQPCDVSLFAPLKNAWEREVREHTADNPGEEVTKKNFARIFKEAWSRSAVPKTISVGFEKSGIFPVDRSRISSKLLMPSLVFHDENDSCSSRHPTPLQPTPSPTQPTTPPPLKTLDNRLRDVLNETLTTPEKAVYKRRVDEGYNLPGSPSYRLWKKLNIPEETQCDHSSTQSSAQVEQTYSVQSPTQSSAQVEQTYSVQSPSSPTCLLRSVLTYPLTGDRKKACSSRQGNKLPCFLTSQSADIIMQEGHLKFLRGVAAKQDRLRAIEEKKEAKEEEAAKKREERAKKKKVPTATLR